MRPSRPSRRCSVAFGIASTEPADPELVSRDALEQLVAPVVVAPAA